MSNSTENNLNATSVFPENFVQRGSNIDNEISMHLSRAIWRALAVADSAMRARLNTCLQEEIESLQLQSDMNGNDDEELSMAVARLLHQFILPAD